MNDTHDAYLAGFFDADGCVSLYARRSGHELKVTVVQVLPEVLELFRARFGGKICGPFNNGRAARPIWHWNVYAIGARDALAVMQPWLLNKKRHAEIALEYRETSKYRNSISAELAEHRNLLHAEMKQLNRRGTKGRTTNVA